MNCEIKEQAFDGKAPVMGITTGFIIHHTYAEKDFLNEHPLRIPTIYSPTADIKESPVLTIVTIQFKVKVEDVPAACKEIQGDLTKAKDNFMALYNTNKNLLSIRDEIYQINCELKIRKERLTEWSNRIEDNTEKMITILNVILQSCKKRRWGELKSLECLPEFNKGELWISNPTNNIEINSKEN